MNLWNLFRRSPPSISEEEALRIARNLCQDKGWFWREPVYVKLTWRGWFIITNWGKRGAIARILINKHTGTVIEAGYVPR